MAGRTYSDAVKQAVFEAYCSSPYPSLEDLAKRFNPSLKTLLRWSKEENWPLERERRQSSPVRLDQGLLSALSKELPHLESPDEERRVASIERCYKIAAIRSKLGTNQVDKGPVAVALASHLKNLAKEKLREIAAPEHRVLVAEALGKLLLLWVEQIHAKPEEALK